MIRPLRPRNVATVQSATMYWRTVTLLLAFLAAHLLGPVIFGPLMIAVER